MSGNFRSLKAWQHADQLVVVVYRITKRFPADERYGLIQQMRRSAVSVAANIAEGATRSSEREYAQFLSMARGSLAELEYYLSIAKRLGYFDEEASEEVTRLHRETARTLHGLLRSVKQRNLVGAVP